MEGFDLNALESQLSRLSTRELIVLAHDLADYTYQWLGDPTQESINRLMQSIPFLSEVIIVDEILSRLDNLDNYERGHFGVHITLLIPELKVVLDACNERIYSIEPSIEKSELWLESVAREAGANTIVEAAVYLESRGRNNPVDASQLSNEWYEAICLSILHGEPIGRVSTEVLDRVESRTISLDAAANLLTFNDHTSRFFYSRDEEEDHIDAAMLRAVEWFGISGFKPWIQSAVNELSMGTQGIEIGYQGPAFWWLFYWCRSSLALKMAEQQGLESWLWGLINSPIYSRPWLMYQSVLEKPRTRKYLPIAGILPFVWHRIGPSNMKQDVLHEAVELILQTQLRSGGWPTY